jgi:hypothetical protein
MKKNRVHGIAPSKSVAVRWLGAYGKGRDLRSMAEWETNPTRQVACEIMQLNSKAGINHASVGLLVDQSKTRLVRAYAGDSWTVADGHRLVAGRSNKYVTEWGMAGGLKKLAKRAWTGKYIEGTIESPVYTAIVIKDDNERTLTFAKKFSELTGLPVITLMQAHINAACNS